MTQASWFGLVDAAEAPGARPWRSSLAAALEGAAYTIPLSLGSVTLIFSKIGPGIAASAVVATLLALAFIQLTTARSRRPLLYSARFFEATTLAAMLDLLPARLPAWGIADSVGVRIAILCLIVACAAAAVVVLYAARADRFSRHIPSPVFAGFSNSIAIALLLSQVQTLQSLFAGPAGLTGLLVIAATAVVAGVAIRRWLPRWPASACALALGLLIGWGFGLAGQPVPMFGTGGTSLVPPVALANFRALLAPQVEFLALAGWIGGNAAILGAMIFINTSITAQGMSHSDDRPAESQPWLLWSGACIAMAGAVGAAPLSGSLQSSAAAARATPLSALVLAFSAVTFTLIALSGILSMVPLAAVTGALLCEAFYMVDRRSLRLLRQWFTRSAIDRHALEDLALVAAVTATAILVNMVAAVLAGLLLGLILFASRHLVPPVRAVWDGSQLVSNCARSRADLLLLARHGTSIRILELEGDLFFGTMDSLDRALRAALSGASCVVIDWNGVRHVDSSVVQTLVKFQRAAQTRGVLLVHVDPAVAGADVSAALAGRVPQDQTCPDLDRALERAENHLLKVHATQPPAESTSMMEAMSLFLGLGEGERALLEGRMTQQLFQPGEIVVRAGDPGDRLMIVLHGSASVLVARGSGTVRVAGMRRGAIIGEVAFLDHAPRSATVVAHDELVVAVLDRDAYDALSREAPALVQKLLANLALYLAARLRHTTRLAAGRHSQRRA